MQYMTMAGEPSMDTTWANKLRKFKEYDHLTLVTKNPGAFIKSELEYAIEQNKDKVTIYSCITGYGKSPVEPMAPTFQSAILSTKYLIDQGYDVVLYIKPIFPTTIGFNNVIDLINYARIVFSGLKDIRIQFDFIQRIENEEERGLVYPWISEEYDALPMDDNSELDIVSASTIIDFFRTLESDEGAVISTTNHSIKFESWWPKDITYFEILEGEDIYHQCRFGCRYCNLKDYVPDESDNAVNNIC